MDLKSKTPLLKYSELEIERVLAKSNKKVENIGKDIQIIKEWMNQQQHLPFTFNDRQILFFLNCNEFSLEKAKLNIDMYFTLKSQFPEFYSFNLNQPSVINFLDNYNLFPLPKLSKNMKRILLSQAVDPKHFDVDIFFCQFCNMLEVLSCEDVNDGWEILLDLTFASNEMIEKLTQEKIMKMYFILEKKFSRSFNVHVVTTPRYEHFMEKLLKSSKPEFHDKIFSHKTYESLLEHYEKDLLPKDFGGDLKTLKEFHDDWKNYYLSYRNHLEKHMMARTCENLRTMKIIDEDVMKVKV